MQSDISIERGSQSRKKKMVDNESKRRNSQTDEPLLGGRSSSSPSSADKDKIRKKEQGPVPAPVRLLGGVLFCSSFTPYEFEIKEKEQGLKHMTATITKTTSITETITLIDPPKGLENDIEKKKKEQRLLPVTDTITRNISTNTISFITPTEDPENVVCIYVCLENIAGPNRHCYSWSKIDLTDQSHPQCKSVPTFLPTISFMHASTPSDFCVIASTDSSPFYKKKKNKLVYAVGGWDTSSDLEEDRKSSRAFVCDFGSKPLAWKELPPMPSPMSIRFGLVSPSDGKVHVYGVTTEEVQTPSFPFPGEKTVTGRLPVESVFDPASCSWTSLRPTHDVDFERLEYYAFDHETNELVLFMHESDHVPIFNFTTHSWWEALVASCSIPHSSVDKVSSSVVVGDTVYKYSLGELYALDKTSPSFYFQLVPGLSKKVDPCLCDSDFVVSSYLFYIGKGKFALVWGFQTITDRVLISCLKFWVGLSNQTHHRCVLIDQLERYVADGCWFRHCVAL